MSLLKTKRAKSIFTIGNILWLTIAVILSPWHLAHAYIDPGTGSYIIQVTIGAMFGATYAIKAYGHRIILFFRSRRVKKKD